MKVKRDFVTNSSSCSYLVFIPDGFEVEKYLHLIEEEINDIVDNEWFDVEDLKTKEQVIKAIKDQIDILKHSGQISYSNDLYYAISNLLEELDLVIDEPETGGGDGSGAMINISADNTREKLKNILSGGWGIKHGGWGIETKI